MKRRRKLLVTLGILGVGVVGVAVIVALKPKAVPQTPPPRTPVVRVISADPSPLQFVVKAHGTVVPRRDGELVPQVSGNIEWISPLLASGGFFDEGEVLVRIDRADYEVARESARAAVARTESENRRASRELSRQKRLADRSVASETNLDDALNKARVAEAALREAKARLEQAERDLSRTELVAPYAGRVRSADVDVGQFVSRGMAIARIYSVDVAEVRLPVPDSELDYLELPLLDRGEADEAGPRVLLRARFGGRDHVWEGRITRTEGEIDPRSRMVHVIAQVADPYGRTLSDEERRGRMPLAVGLFVEAEIMGRKVDSAVELPRAALRADDKVLVVDAESKLYARPVDLLRVEADRVIVGDGLQAGDRVVVTPLRVAIDGMRVRAVPVDDTTGYTERVANGSGASS
jgi:RND family efflux transporter MFP subunit